MSFSELLEDTLQDMAQNMQVGLIAKIDKFEKDKMRADVKPLLKLKNAQVQLLKLPIV